jgi:propanol-preferring alcohol dehydrogenase
MRAWRIHRLASLDELEDALQLDTVERPQPGPGEVLVRVSACGICHTELDELEGRTPPPRLPVIPGHQAVGTVVGVGDGVPGQRLDEAVGVAWIHSACGHCEHCLAGRENLCPEFRGCGRDADGGYAEYLRVPAGYALPLPTGLDPDLAAPLLCAGAVGLRAIRLCGLQDGETVGLTGFGASGHLSLQMLQQLFPRSPVFVFARNPDERIFAEELGADWTGDTTATPPCPPAAIIDTTPAWKPVLAALAALAPGGRLVINAIAKESGDRDQWLDLDYQRHLWREKVLRTVTNVTREDVADCLALAARARLRPEIEWYDFDRADAALRALRGGAQRGARVLRIR